MGHIHSEQLVISSSSSPTKGSPGKLGSGFLKDYQELTTIFEGIQVIPAEEKATQKNTRAESSQKQTEFKHK